MISDVYERKQQRFFTNQYINNLLEIQLGLANVPILFEGQTSLKGLKQLLNNTKSRYGKGLLESLFKR
ncbi:hypothetical protein [Thalassolituus sp.]|jgi:hypothetical protein|uniref:hypothetical protein n=1 Tax=Thalassolituus sp. TaxID=2030822 RepID=UPI0032D8F12B